MTTPPQGYRILTKTAQALAKGDEILYGGRVWLVMGVQWRPHGIVIVRFHNRQEITYPASQRFTVRRPAQWIAPSHTGEAGGMPDVI